MVFGDAVSTIEMLDLWILNHLASVYPKSIKLGQMTSHDLPFHGVSLSIGLNLKLALVPCANYQNSLFVHTVESQLFEAQRET